MDDGNNIGRVTVFIQELPILSRESRDQMLRHVRQVKLWSQQEAEERQKWDATAPTTSMCDECGTINPLDTPFCCNCGSLIDGYRSREATEFRFVVSNQIQNNIREAIQAFEKFVVTAKGYRPRFIVCVECGKSNPVEKRFCTNCGSRLDAANLPQAHNDPVHIALLREISRLEIILQHSKDEEVHLLSLKKEEPAVRACSGCGEMNPMDELFCRECGNDIEILRRHKKL